MLSVACGEKMIAWMGFRIGDWLIDKGGSFEVLVPGAEKDDSVLGVEVISE